MKQPLISVSFFLDASRTNSEGKSLIKMNIYHKPNKKRYSTNFHLTKEEWTKLNGVKLRDAKLQFIKKAMNKLKDGVEKILEEIEPFSFFLFEEKFFNNKNSIVGSKEDNRLLSTWFNNAIGKLHLEDRVGTASSYQTTLNSITHFKRNLQIHDITYPFLISYEKYLINAHKSTSTVGIYMRNLRAITNQAIKAKIMLRDNYPFKEYEIPTSQNVKKSLSDFDISQLLNFKTERLDYQKAMDFWIFSYLCGGINFADIIKLKPENISGNHLSFFRQKTIRTKKKDLRPIKIGLNSRAISIISKWKNTDPANPYLFPILESDLSAKTVKNRCQRFIKWVNKRMYEICIELCIENKTSTYSARHTFSTVLKRKGVPTSFIKDALGHSSMTVTENYLGSFEDNIILEYANALTQFDS